MNRSGDLDTIIRAAIAAVNPTELTERALAATDAVLVARVEARA